MKLNPEQKKSTSIPERVPPEPFSEALFERPFHHEPPHSRKPEAHLSTWAVDEKASRVLSDDLLQILANRKEKS